MFSTHIDCNGTVGTDDYVPIGNCERISNNTYENAFVLFNSPCYISMWWQWCHINVGEKKLSTNNDSETSA